MKTKLYFRYGIVALLFLIQLLFLLAIFRENRDSYLVPAFVGLLALLTLYTYRKRAIHHPAQEYESPVLALWVPVGAVASYFLHQKLGLGPVLGAAIVGTAASLLPEIRKDSVYLAQLPPAIYCGAFVGMSDPAVAGDLKFVLTAGFFAGVFLVVSRSMLSGIGGKLGTLAFLGVLTAYLLIKVWS